jgi:hypothetical protein
MRSNSKERGGDRTPPPKKKQEEGEEEDEVSVIWRDIISAQHWKCGHLCTCRYTNFKAWTNTSSITKL